MLDAFADNALLRSKPSRPPKSVAQYLCHASPIKAFIGSIYRLQWPVIIAAVTDVDWTGADECIDC